MQVRDFDIRQIHVFVSVVRCGGLSAAQDYLNMALPTISGHLKSLEERVGLSLCIRGRGGFELTEEGDKFYHKAIQLVDVFNEFSDFAKNLGDNLNGSIHIGMTDQSLRDFPVSETFEKYYQRDNSIVAYYYTDSEQSLYKKVQDRDLDIAIGVADPKARNAHVSGLEFEPLFTETHLLFCGDHHPLANETNIKKSQLQGCRFYQRGFTPDDGEKIGSTHLGAIINDASTALALLLSGQFIGFFPAQIARTWVESGQLKPIIISGIKDEVEIGYITRQEENLSPGLKIFMEDFLDSVSKHRKELDSGQFDVSRQLRHVPILT